MDVELMRNIHRELLQEIRERERGIWKFWTIMISALGSWILASLKYLKEYNTGSPEYLWLFLGASIFVLILLFWGAWLVLAYGYHYRMFQKVLYNIEEECCLTSKIIPSSWNPCDPCKKGKLDLPMLYRVHLYTFSFAIASVTIPSFFVVLKKSPWHPILLTFLGIIVLGGILCAIFELYSRYKLRKKRESLCLEEVQQCAESQ